MLSDYWVDPLALIHCTKDTVARCEMETLPPPSYHNQFNVFGVVMQSNNCFSSHGNVNDIQICIDKYFCFS